MSDNKKLMALAGSMVNGINDLLNEGLKEIEKADDATLLSIQQQLLTASERLMALQRHVLMAQRGQFKS